jgi:hypothetical protein
VGRRGKNEVPHVAQEQLEGHEALKLGTYSLHELEIVAADSHCLLDPTR